jgi:hypothetical protein
MPDMQPDLADDEMGITCPGSACQPLRIAKS